MLLAAKEYMFIQYIDIFKIHNNLIKKTEVSNE